MVRGGTDVEGWNLMGEEGKEKKGMRGTRDAGVRGGDMKNVITGRGRERMKGNEKKRKEKK